jgi:hypothetical protein
MPTYSRKPAHRETTRNYFSILHCVGPVQFEQRTVTSMILSFTEVTVSCNGHKMSTDFYPAAASLTLAHTAD